MTFEHTQQQTSDEQMRAQALSLKRNRPPTEVPGYEPKRFLGAGAYGEVWVALDRTTGRQVAIKFYAHRGGLDWSLLSREVEKLTFLSADRYVVQLLDVGWDAEPPYYVMEYIERGSLEDLLRREGKLPPAEAAALFRDVAVGMLHAHAKGVLHCDLKPANVLLDQDSKPRLADFGQSRLSHEQTPALGTLFYMAPEQADLAAVPDVRWDVYALGALLYSMLTDAPPHRTEETISDMETASDLDERLTRYRELIARSPPPSQHRSVPGVDRALAEIIDGCLAADPKQRYANIQEVLDALDARQKRRARRPLVVLGAIGPALILIVMSLVAWRLFQTVVNESDDALRVRALKSNSFAAKYAAKTVTNALELRYRAVEEMGTSPNFQRLVKSVLTDPELTRLREQLNDPDLDAAERETVRAEFLKNPKRQELQNRLDELWHDETEPSLSSWFVTDPSGLQLARAPEGPTVGMNFGWRTYFHGRENDDAENWRPTKPDDHITQTTLSSPFRSQAEGFWAVAITTPVQAEDDGSPFLGVVGLTVEVGKLVDFPQDADRQFAVLVDWRNGEYKGLILQHPLFDKLVKEQKKVPDRLENYRLKVADSPEHKENRENYVDPMGADPDGDDFDKHWLAEMARVSIRDGNTGWVVIVQESYQQAIRRTLDQLESSLWRSGLAAVGLVALLLTLLWGFVIRSLNEPGRRPPRPAVEPGGAAPDS